MKRDFTYIDDIISGIEFAIEKNYKCEVFNLGNNKSEKLMDMISLIEEELGKKATINFMPMQLGDVVESFADIEYTEKKLGFYPKISIKNGIPMFINWFKDFYTK
tara:strand:- start:1093 stop:1407 length:315 start_codon:yes stop_codon:yes gene_type:complete